MCVYGPGTYCDCVYQITYDAGRTLTWTCNDPGPDCPSNRPRLGSVCDSGIGPFVCGYSEGCDAIEQCQGPSGTWGQSNSSCGG
jgi:hypothetical protein